MPIIPGQYPNEAYEIGHLPAREHDLPPDWWTVFCNGIPVRHCAPDRRDLAERYATDPDYEPHPHKVARSMKKRPFESASAVRDSAYRYHCSE
jgi:hypothetical protein